MSFTLSDELQMLRDTLRPFLAGVRPQPDDPIWRALADDLQLLSLALPPERGGLAEARTACMLIMEELGTARIGVPFLEVVIVAGGLLRRADGAASRAALDALAAGKLRVVLAASAARGDFEIDVTASQEEGGWRLAGAARLVAAAASADRFIVPARIAGDPAALGLFLVEAQAPGIAITSFPTIDGRTLADIVFDGPFLSESACIAHGEDARRSLALARDEALAGLAAEAVGLLGRLYGDTVAYLKQREQFGQPLARFQVVQHRVADMYMAMNDAISASRLATLQLGADEAERARACAAAKVVVNDALRFVGQNAVQLHGGMGMTDELELGHYFRRATVIERDAGDTHSHLRRHADLGAAAR